MLITSQPEEIEHGHQAEPQIKSAAASPVEQGEDGRIEAAPSDKERLVNKNQTPDRRTRARPGYVQRGHRQQTAGLRCREPQG